jgi:RNA recognition motif-containing protein
MSDFTVKVNGFPHTVIEPDELFKHFNQFGEVIEVCLARDYSNTLFYYTEAAQLQRKIRIEEKRVIFLNLISIPINGFHLYSFNSMKTGKNPIWMN